VATFRPNGPEALLVLTASIVDGVAMFVIAVASNVNGFLVGMAIGGLGFGISWPSTSRSLSTCCRTRATPPRTLAYSSWPALFRFPSPAILAMGGGSYGVLYGVAEVCAIIRPSPSCP
jgi:hypothetical protein